MALHQLYQYTNKYYDEIINALEEDPAAQKMQLAFRLQQIAAALENKVTDLWLKSRNKEIWPEDVQIHSSC